MKDLTEQVAVITGASSGIGRATAIEFARRGAKVVLAARDGDALKETERECESVGGTAMPIVCDVTAEAQVEQLASRAEEAFGHIDIWVNNAGVNMFGKFDETPSDDFKRVIDTNFFGYVYGARAAIKRFKAQGSGTLINVDSVEGVVSQPYNSAYAASKHAVRALASSLRMELALDGVANVQICTVMPANVDTPLLAHAANYTGQSIQGSERSASPVRVAEAIVKLVRHPQREVIVGPEAKGQMMKHMLGPSNFERQAAKSFPRRFFGRDEAAQSRGNLFETTGPHTVHGGWRRERPRTTLKTKLPWVALAGTVVGLGGLAAWLMWPNRPKTAR